MGLALMEQIVLENGLVRNASFTDYVIPVTLDMPDLTIAAWVEEPEPGVPCDAKGIAEPTTTYFPAAVGADREPLRVMRRLWGSRRPLHRQSAQIIYSELRRDYDQSLSSVTRSRPSVTYQAIRSHLHAMMME